MKTKPGKEEAYAKYAKMNSEEEYGKACVDSGEAVATLLDEGKTGEEALLGLKGHGLTGFMAFSAAKAVAHFHPRGLEVMRAWNKQWGAEKLTEGMVNPAVVEIDDDGKMTPTVEGV